MSREKVYITRPIQNEAISLLKEHFDVTVSPEDRVVDRDVLMDAVEDVDALLCLINDTVDREVIGRAKRARIIANYGVGYNNIDVPAATERGIVVTNTPGVLTDATADLAWGLLLATARRIVESDKYTRAGRYESWSPNLLLGRSVAGKTLGIIGAGRIGRAVARRGLGFDMKLLYHNRRRDEGLEKELNARWVDRETLLKESDFVSLHVPLTDETWHMIGRREFETMKDTAVLINTSRGPVVDEKAMVDALREGLIWAAGLDVYEREPAVEEGLKALDNVVLASHIGSATIEARTRMAMMAAENIVSVLKGGKPLTPVNEVPVKE
ncbi:MAG: 2-hydroxyacid dehydrogenase [Clostridia bacterium]|nr:D-glycerate dehydrogenase [Clostridiales bacterium]